ncbi:MAG TPA: hypothetical protein PKC55_10770 [Dysgonomonas sp.]|uniref:hypothetical protein n=1 Tax=unclassified Dysgonomonas TaxID=2630389 RepID=UPI0025BC9EC5|nr:MULTISPECIES: hypothetical protein [unclassified Dysgonomonas]HML65302.1 hypothetical protein [Dysgonomonas sp.]
MKSKNDIKQFLERKLHAANAFWSYEKNSCRNLSDRDLIKHVLIHLDLDDIQLLFDIYPKRQIKRVWLDELVPQGDYLISMNLCFALLYFDIKKPLQYLKSMETRHFNKIATGYG